MVFDLTQKPSATITCGRPSRSTHSHAAGARSRATLDGFIRICASFGSSPIAPKGRILTDTLLSRFIWTEHRFRYQPRRARRQSQVRPMTRPPALGGSRHHPGTHRIVVHLSNERPSVRLPVNPHALRPVRQNRAQSLALRVDSVSERRINLFCQAS